MRRLLTLIAVLGMLALYVLALATGHASKLAQYFWWILTFSAALLGILLTILISQLWKLWLDRRRRVFGSQTALRLAKMFMLVAILPGLFLFGVSAQFISHSINSWFGNETEQALERSLNLSKSALDLALDTTVRKAATVQVALIGEMSLQQDAKQALGQLSANSDFDQLALYDSKTLSPAAEYRQPDADKLPPPELTRDILEQVKTTGSARSVANVGHTLYAQGWLALPELHGQHYILFFRQPVQKQVADDVTLIEAARARYAEISYAKQGLQTFFLFTLLMATLLAILLALVIALFFAQRFTAPILSLAAGARSVAQGDYSQQLAVYRNDELGRLTTLFNHMTAELNTSHSRQEAARHYLECVLSSLTSGVVTLDDQGYLKACNSSAGHILMLDLAACRETSVHEWHKLGVAEALAAQVLLAILPTVDSDKPVQLTYAAPDESRILLGKATRLPEDNGAGTVLVFDDVTALVQAQKEAAWGEVAQRLAHEIRNPLTPIQLSAERLAWKLDGKLDDKDAAMLERATNTIVNQVAAMKDMVEAFRNYAKAPKLKLEHIDLNILAAELLVLYEGSNCTFEADFSNIEAVVEADAGAMRQVLHNILKNGAEAAAADEQPKVLIQTAVQDDKVLLTICNNGKSFSEDMLLHAFDPYVTDKPGGTGLGLPVVKKIIEEHKGRISLANRPEGGACVKITLPLLMENDAQQ
ncbi:PAS domain-containing sensor histidine kinase [Eikenella corrodens]|uniref:histidine kinase n=1 Tax=Eikenella corrodens TaxID=539 RepID=A0A1A9RE27_EIKCO|nr:PAS domain-containing sensor histidine kinase [Eikenella corrodens]OAM16033.1 PAS domain-containing sensor histidine kinase [Eikenella corrodens]OAM24778.1 PAS domain-containing sensor histidine kinase [Eikenella corrodens]